MTDPIVKHYRSTTPAAVPTLSEGQIAVNMNDGKIFFGPSGGGTGVEIGYVLPATLNNYLLLTGGTISGALNVNGILTLGDDVTAGAYYIEFDDGAGVSDSNGNKVMVITKVTSAVNHINITNAATGTPPLIQPAGTDANIALRLQGKGISKVQLGDANLNYPDVDGVNRELLQTDGSGNLSWAKNPLVSSLLHIQDQKAQGVQGQSLSSGAWRTKDLNTVVTNEISGASLATNQITLPAGTYWADISSPVYGQPNASLHKAKLYNITDAANTIIGTSERCSHSSNSSTCSFITGKFTIAGAKVFEVQHRVGNSITGGTHCDFFGTIEIYTDVKIWKLY